MRNLYTDSQSRHYSSSSFNGGRQRPTYPNCSCCCCCCCSCNLVSSIPITTASSSRLVALNSAPFYGFTQSALIMKGASRLCIRDLGFDWIELRSGLEKLGAGCDDAESIISLLNEESGECDWRMKKVKRLKSRRSGNRGMEIDETRKKCEQMRGRSGFVDGKFSTYVKEDSDSEEFVSKVYNFCDDAENIISLLSEESGECDWRMKKVKRLKSKEELKGRRSDDRAMEIAELRKKYEQMRGRIGFVDGKFSGYVREDSESEEFVGSGSGRRICESRVSKVYNIFDDAENIISLLNEESGDNRASEIAESWKKRERMRGRSGFVDGKFRTYVREDSDSEEFVGFGGRRDCLSQSVQCESRVSKVCNFTDEAEAIISLLNEESGDESFRDLKKVTKKGNFRRSEKYHRGDYDTVKMQCSSGVAESRSRYERLRERIGFVDGKSTISVRKDSDSEEYVGLKSGRRDHINQSVQSESRISKLYKSRNHLKDSRGSNKYEHLRGSSSFVDEKSSRYLSKVSDSEEFAGSVSEQRNHLSQSVQSESRVSNSHKDNRASNKYEHLTGSKEHVISAGGSSDSSYKCKYMTDSSGYLSRRSDNEGRVFSAGGLCSSCGKANSESEARTTKEQRSQVYDETKFASSSSSVADKAQEQRKQEQFVASGQMNLMKSEKYTERADVAESYEENSDISRLRSELSETRLSSTVRQQSEIVVDEKSHQENIVASSKTESMKENQEYTDLVEAKMASVSAQTAKEELFQTGQKQSNKAQSGSSQVYIGGKMIEETSSASEEMLRYSQTHVKERIKQTEVRYEVEIPLKEPSFVSSSSQVRIEEICEDQDKRNTPSVPSPRITEQVQSESDSSDKYEHQTGIDSFVDEKSSRYLSKVSGSEEHVISVGEISDLSYRYDHTADSSGLNMMKSEVYEENTNISRLRSEQFERLVESGESNVKVLEQNTGSVSSQSDEQELFQTGQKQPLRNQSSISQLIKDSSSASEEALQYEQSYETREHDKETIKQTELIHEVQMPLKEPSFVTSTSQSTEVEPEHASQSGIVKRSGRVLWNVLTYGVLNMADNVSGDTKIELNTDKMSSEATVSADDKEMIIASSTELEDLFQTGLKKSFKAQSGNSEVDFDSTMIESSSSSEEIMDTSNEPSFSKKPFGASSSQIRIVEIDEDQDLTNISPSQSGVGKRSGKAVWNARAFGVLNTGKSINVGSSSEENGEELKRRGGLVRSNQVMKERFDEWEEAYKLNNEQREIDQMFMREALEEAKKAADMWEVPVGAVLVQDGKIIARGHNLVEESRDSTAHAEMVCIRAASTMLKTWRLSGTTLYVTLEPCAMCAGAILQSRIAALVYGAPNKLLGADGSWVRLFPTSVNEEEGSAKTEGPVHPFHPNMKIRRGILEEECGELMQQSFKLRRSEKGKKIEQKSDKKLHINPSKLLNKMNHKFHILFHL